MAAKPYQYVGEPDDDLKCVMWFKTHCNLRSVESCSARSA